MIPDLWLENLAAYSIQIAVLIAVSAALVKLLRIRNPGVLYRGWQVLLALCLAAPLLQPWKTAAAGDPAAAPAAASAVLLASAPGLGIAGIVCVVASLGVMARCLLLAVGLVHLRRLRRAARQLHSVPEPLSRLRDELAPRAGLYLSPKLAGAASFGLRRPAVLLPETFLQLDLPTQEAMLCHELLHVKRRDWAFALAEEIARSVFWFHPAVWWAVERIQLAREQAVDREVVVLLGERDAYLDALLYAASLRAPSGLATAPTFLRPRHLRQRVELILKEDVMSKNRLTLSAATVACAAMLMAGWAGWSFPLQAPDYSGPSGDVYKIGDGVSAPRLIQKIEPEYTDEAREAKLQGSVVLAIEVGADGFVQEAQVERGLGLGLDENAVAAIRQWQFSPALKGGQPVAVAAKVEVNYRLM
jgi:TonB family protein